MEHKAVKIKNIFLQHMYMCIYIECIHIYTRTYICVCFMVFMIQMLKFLIQSFSTLIAHNLHEYKF